MEGTLTSTTHGKQGQAMHAIQEKEKQTKKGPGRMCVGSSVVWSGSSGVTAFHARADLLPLQVLGGGSEEDGVVCRCVCVCG